MYTTRVNLFFGNRDTSVSTKNWSKRCKKGLHYTGLHFWVSSDSFSTFFTSWCAVILYRLTCLHCVFPGLRKAARRQWQLQSSGMRFCNKTRREQRAKEISTRGENLEARKINFTILHTSLSGGFIRGEGDDSTFFQLPFLTPRVRETSHSKASVQIAEELNSHSIKRGRRNKIKSQENFANSN